jgi:hypothetical protein
VSLYQKAESSRFDAFSDAAQTIQRLARVYQELANNCRLTAVAARLAYALLKPGFGPLAANGILIVGIYLFWPASTNREIAMIGADRDRDTGALQQPQR